MFYMHLLVNKRGPLAKIWLAAHWEKKLTKAHIFECNLETTVTKIISPKFTIALRTSGHLLLGVVRIYHRKAKYLLADCSEALTKMKTAFRPGLVDLPEENFEAAYQSITLPEEFHDFETPLPDLNAIDVAEHFTLNQSRAEDITLTEDYESNILLCDRNFDEEPDALRKRSFFDGSILTSSNSLVADHNSASVNGDKSALHEDTYCFENDCFGDEEDAADMIEILLRDEQNGLDKDILDMEEERPLSQDLPENSTAIESSCADTTIKKVSHLTNETILLLKEEEGFVLEPVDDTEMLTVEEPSYLQESAHSETERKLRNDSFMSTTRNNRNETDDTCGETIPQDGTAFSESSSLANNSLGQEAETQRAELTNEPRSNGKDSEEIRWNKRTLQLLKTLQHLKRSGVCSFSLRELCRKSNRKEAAAKFYIFLVLKKQSVIELHQSAPFADITATLGPMFNTQ
ncbi:hypothetical protein QYF61_012157 [Mycteria americana]|uniref:RD21L protein n=1 Tax=Mycteria americana TaxID=33587 RepID=A0AAN7NC36_MYCAM|nr:hypothetical protein QYF61_012157 [Mycteria americana]